MIACQWNGNPPLRAGTLGLRRRSCRWWGFLLGLLHRRQIPAAPPRRWLCGEDMAAPAVLAASRSRGSRTFGALTRHVLKNLRKWVESNQKADLLSPRKLNLEWQDLTFDLYRLNEQGQLAFNVSPKDRSWTLSANFYYSGATGANCIVHAIKWHITLSLLCAFEIMRIFILQGENSWGFSILW